MVVVLQLQRAPLQLEHVTLLHIHKHGRGNKRHGICQTHEDGAKLGAGLSLVPEHASVDCLATAATQMPNASPRTALNDTLHQLVRFLGALSRSCRNALWPCDCPAQDNVSA